MTAHEKLDKTDIWTKLAAPIAREDLQWRIDGKPAQRGGKWFARAVCYADVPVVVARLDAVVPGEWDFTTAALRPHGTPNEEVAVKGRLQVLGVIREDVGQGPDYKQALTDAIKRTARLFGIALELWTMGPVWVEVDGEGKYAKIVGDPWRAYDAAHETPAKPVAAVPAGGVQAAERALANAPAVDDYGHQYQQNTQGVNGSHRPATPATTAPDYECCGKPMYDNRASKRNPKAPDFKCKVDGDHVVWLPGNGKQGSDKRPMASVMDTASLGADDDIPY